MCFWLPIEILGCSNHTCLLHDRSSPSHKEAARLVLLPTARFSLSLIVLPTYTGTGASWLPARLALISLRRMLRLGEKF